MLKSRPEGQMVEDREQGYQVGTFLDSQRFGDEKPGVGGHRHVLNDGWVRVHTGHRLEAGGELADQMV